MPKTNIAESEAEPASEAAVAEAAMPVDANAEMGMGMMAGVPGMGGRRGGGAAPAEVKYDPTVWGRYTKLLLSSSEFIFVN
jgi:hypothetical protein